jgi:O-antigen ligase
MSTSEATFTLDPGSPDSTSQTFEKLWRWQVGLALCCLSVLPAPPFSFLRYLLPKWWVASLLVLWVGLRCLRRAALAAPDLTEWCLLGALALGSLASLGAANRWFALDSLLLYGQALVLFAVIRRAADERRRSLLQILGAVSFLVGLAVLADAFGWLPGLALPGRRPAGFLGNRNYAAHLQVLGVVSLWFFTFDARGLKAWWLAAAWSVSLAALLVSRCRTAWIATLCVSLLALAVGIVRALLAGHRRQTIPRAVAPVAIGALLAGVMAAMAPTDVWRSSRPYRDTMGTLVELDQGSGRGRLLQARHTLRMAAAHPLLGVGPGNWSTTYPLHAPADDPNLPQNLHDISRFPTSDWLGMLAEWGIPAALLILSAVGALLWSALRADAGSAAGGVTLAALAIALVGLGDSALYRPEYAVFAACLLGALAPLQPPGAGAGQRRRAPALLVGLLGLVVGAAGVLRSSGMIVSQREMVVGRPGSLARAWRLDPGNHYLGYQRALQLAGDGRCDEARAAALAVRRLFPGTPARAEVEDRCRLTKEAGGGGPASSSATGREGAPR